MDYDTRQRLLNVRRALMRNSSRDFICVLMNLLRIDDGTIPELIITKQDSDIICPGTTDLLKMPNLSDAAFHKLVLFNINASLLEEPLSIIEMYALIADLVTAYPFPFHYFAAEIISTPGCIDFLRDNIMYLSAQFSLEDILTDRPGAYKQCLWTRIRESIPSIRSLQDVYLIEKQQFSNQEMYFWVYKYYYKNERLTMEGLIQLCNQSTFAINNYDDFIDMLHGRKRQLRKRVPRASLQMIHSVPKPATRPAIRRAPNPSTTTSSTLVCMKCKYNEKCDYIGCMITSSNTKDFTACRETTFGGHRCKLHRTFLTKEIQRTGPTLKLPAIYETKDGVKIRGFRLNNMCIRIPVNGQQVIIDCSGVFVQCSMQGLFEQDMLCVSLHLHHYLNTNIYHIGTVQNSRMLYGDLKDVYVIRDASMIALRNQTIIPFPNMVYDKSGEFIVVNGEVKHGCKPSSLRIYEQWEPLSHEFGDITDKMTLNKRFIVCYGILQNMVKTVFTEAPQIE